MQVFATERGDGASTGLGLYYSGNAEYNANDVKGGGTATAPTGDGCGDDYEDNGDDCKVTNAAANAEQQFRIIFDELLKGPTVEQFACACTADTGNCPNNVTASIDPSNCQNNPDTTADEGGRWLDANNDGMPDDAVLIDGIVSFVCDGTKIYSTTPDDGFYNPSGNQLIPVAQGLGGLGPALVITASQGLKTDADCAITIGDTVVDKSDEKVPALPATVTFHTEKLAVLTSTPPDMTDGVDPAPDVTLTFTGLIEATTATGATGVVLREKTGQVVVADAVVTLAADDKSTVKIAHGALKPSTVYEVVIPDTIADIWGGKSSGYPIITFTTKAP